MANYYKEISKMVDKLVHRALIADKKGFKTGIKGETLSLLEIHILRKISEKENKKIYELVEELEIDRGILSSSINRLTASQLIIKEKSKLDKRVFFLKLTEEGRVIVEKSLEKQKALLEHILSDVTLNEEKAILKFLSKMNQVTRAEYKK